MNNLWNFNIADAPRDRTLLLLLIQRGDKLDHPTEDVAAGGTWRTFGFNNFANDGEDKWQYPGREHDHFTSVDVGGTPVAWMLFPALEQTK